MPRIDYRNGMPKLLVLLLGLVSTLLVVTTTVSAQPLSDLQQEALVAKDSDLSDYGDDDNSNEDYDHELMNLKRSLLLHPEFVRDRRSPYNHALRIRSSSMSHALRVKKSPIPGDDFLRFSRYSPVGHALRIKKGSSAHALRIKKGSSAHALRIKKGTSAYHALRVRRNGETDEDYQYSFVMPEHSFYKRPAYNSYVLRV